MSINEATWMVFSAIDKSALISMCLLTLIFEPNNFMVGSSTVCLLTVLLGTKAAELLSFEELKQFTHFLSTTQLLDDYKSTIEGRVYKVSP